MSFTNDVGPDGYDTSTHRPFEVHSIIGYNPDVPLVNLTVTDIHQPLKERRSALALVATNIVSVHTFNVDAVRNTATVQHMVGGHVECIHTLMSDATARFIMSASDDACCIWDRKLLVNNVPAAIRHLRTPFGAGGVLQMASMSPDGKYLLLVGHEAAPVVRQPNVPAAAPAQNKQNKAAAAAAQPQTPPPPRAAPPPQQLQFWLWSAGTEQPACVRQLPDRKYGSVTAISFNPFAIEAVAEFAITMRHMCLFGQWHQADPQALRIRRPGNCSTVDAVEYLATAFCELKRNAITISDAGSCTLWTSSPGSAVYKAKKSMLVGNLPLTSISYVDHMAVVLSADGRLRFYTDELHMIYDSGEATATVVSNVLSYSFDLTGRFYRMSDGVQQAHEEQSDEPNAEVLERQQIPRCTNDDARPFIVRNFVCALRGSVKLQHCDLVRQRNRELNLVVGSAAPIRAFDVHPLRPHLVAAGCTDGRVFIYDLVRMEMVVERRVPNGQAVRFLRFLVGGQELLVASEPNELVVVETVTLVPVCRPLHPTGKTESIDGGGSSSDTSLMKAARRRAADRNRPNLAQQKLMMSVVVMSACTSGNEVIAYVENNNTVVLLRRQSVDGKTTLQLLGKHKSHVDRVQTIRFAGPDDERLLTFADDRQVTEYDIVQTIERGEMVSVRRVEYDQSAKVTCTLLCSPGSSGGAYDLLTFDTHMKVKFWNTKQLPLILRTCLGPTLDGEVIRQAVHLPRSSDDADGDAEYVAFATAGMTMGLHRLPFDGNSFRSVCQLSHPVGIKQILPMPDGRRLLTLGWDGHALFMWTIQRRVVNECMLRGGSGLMPFCRQLPGSRDGWLFREMQDLFYYMQILKRSVDCPEEQVVSDTLTISEVPDYLRGLGLFLSDFEAQNVFVELSDNRLHAIHHLTVTFSELVRVYVNHRPVNGYAFADLERSLREFAGPGTRKTATVDRDRLTQMLTRTGECWKRMDAVRILVALMAAGDGPRVLGTKRATFVEEEQGHNAQAADTEELMKRFDELPEIFDLQEFMENVLGLVSEKVPDNETDEWTFKYAGAKDPGELHPMLNNTTEQRLKWGDND